LTRSSGAGEHHVTIPNPGALKVGTLNAILRDVAARSAMTREDLLKTLLA
jgi:hypothetical protein